jgi:hypothetical protein
MQRDPPQTDRRSRLDGMLGIVAAAILVTAALAIGALVWYPTTLQPAITLTDARFVQTASCVGVNGWYGNEYDWSFTLVNAGSADGYASAQFFVDGNPMGYAPFLVRQHAQVTVTGVTVGNLYPTSAACGGPEVLTVSLASVARSPAIDERVYVQATVSPLSTLILTGGMLGILNHLAHRRGFSIFTNLGSSGWRPAFLTVFAAFLLAGVVTAIFTTPYNYPLDWTPAIVYGTVAGTIGVALFIVACRAILESGRRGRIL